MLIGSTNPTEIDTTDYTSTATPEDLRILTFYNIFENNLPNFSAFTPSQLLHTLRVAVLNDRGKKTLRKSVTKKSLDPLVPYSCPAEWKHLPKDKTPFINEVLAQYSYLSRQSKRFSLNEFSLMRLVLNVWQENSSNFVTIPSCCEVSGWYGTLINKSVVIFQIEQQIGQGCYGVVHKVKSSFSALKVIKVARKEHNRTHSVANEWRILKSIHEFEVQEGIQKLPIGLALIKNDGELVDCLLDNFYQCNLKELLEATPCMLNSARVVIALFLPTFKSLAKLSTMLTHNDIRVENIHAQQEQSTLKLFLSDWGKGRFLYKDVSDDSDTNRLKEVLDHNLALWVQKENPELTPVPIEGRPSQIASCANYISLSRDVLCLGEVVFDTLFNIYRSEDNREEDPDDIVWRGFSFDIPEAIGLEFYKLLQEMCNNQYQLHQHDGIELLFPIRPTMVECYERLQEISDLLRTESMESD